MFRASCIALARPKPVGSSSRSFASLCLVISICIGTLRRVSSDACLGSFLRLGLFACLTLLEIAIAIYLLHPSSRDNCPSRHRYGARLPHRPRLPPGLQVADQDRGVGSAPCREEAETRRSRPRRASRACAS